VKLLRLYNTTPVPRALAAVNPLIVCTGERVHPVCAGVLATAHEDAELPGGRFVMSDWVTDCQLRQAAAVWVVGVSPSTACLALAEGSSIPAQSGGAQHCKWPASVGIALFRQGKRRSQGRRTIFSMPILGCFLCTMT
jgi:hypothetical protein